MCLQIHGLYRGLVSRGGWGSAFFSIDESLFARTYSLRYWKSSQSHHTQMRRCGSGLFGSYKRSKTRWARPDPCGRRHATLASYSTWSCTTARDNRRTTQYLALSITCLRITKSRNLSMLDQPQFLQDSVTDVIVTHGLFDFYVELALFNKLLQFLSAHLVNPVFEILEIVLFLF